MKTKGLVIAVLIMACLSGCGEKTPVRDYHRYLVSETTGVSLDSDLLFEMMLYGSVAGYDDDLVLFGHKNMSRVYGYRISADSLILFDSSISARSFGSVLAAMSPDSVWFIHNAYYKDIGPMGALCNMTTGELLYPKSSLPFWGDKYCIVTHNCFPVANGCFYTEVIATDTSLHLATLEENRAYNHWPKVAQWRIDGDSLELVRLFCQYPDEYPATDYEDFMPNVYYNPADSLFILASGDSRVWLFDLNGNPKGERRLGSQLEKPKKPFPITQGSYNNALNWYAANNTYGRVIYDPYRQVYLRVLKIPPTADEEAMERFGDETWVLVVADRNFNVKYEVGFADQIYEWRLVLPTKQGVMIARKKGEKYEEPSLFVFD